MFPRYSPGGVKKGILMFNNLCKYPALFRIEGLKSISTNFLISSDIFQVIVPPVPTLNDIPIWVLSPGKINLSINSIGLSICARGKEDIISNSPFFSEFWSNDERRVAIWWVLGWYVRNARGIIWSLYREIGKIDSGHDTIKSD